MAVIVNKCLKILVVLLFVQLSASRPKDKCSKKPCKNDGICKQDPVQFWKFNCACTRKYSGRFCLKERRGCNEGHCKKVEDCFLTPDGAMCICVVGRAWSSTICKMAKGSDIPASPGGDAKRECNELKCKKMGHCFLTPGGAMCICVGGTSSNTMCKMDLESATDKLNKQKKTSSNDGSKPSSKDGSKSSSRHGSKPSSKDDSKSSSRHGSKPSSRHGSKPSSKDGSKSSSKDGSKSSSRHGSKPSSKDGSKYSSKDGSKSSSRHGSKPSSKDGSKYSSKDGPKPSSKDGSKSSSRHGSKPSSKDGSKSKPSSKDGSKSSSRHGSKPSSKDGSKYFSKDGSKSSRRHGSKPSSKDGSKSSSKNGPKPSSKDGSKSSSRHGSKSSSKDGSKSSSNDGPKPSSKDGSKPSSKDVSKSSSRHGSKPSSKNGSKSSSRHGSKPSSKDGSKPSSKDVFKSSSVDSSKSSHDKLVDIKDKLRTVLDKKNLSDEAIIGIVFGVGVLLFIIILCCCRGKGKKRNEIRDGLTSGAGMDNNNNMDFKPKKSSKLGSKASHGEIAQKEDAWRRLINYKTSVVYGNGARRASLSALRTLRSRSNQSQYEIPAHNDDALRRLIKPKTSVVYGDGTRRASQSASRASRSRSNQSQYGTTPNQSQNNIIDPRTPSRQHLIKRSSQRLPPIKTTPRAQAYTRHKNSSQNMRKISSINKSNGRHTSYVKHTTTETEDSSEDSDSSVSGSETTEKSVMEQVYSSHIEDRQAHAADESFNDIIDDEDERSRYCDNGSYQNSRAYREQNSQYQRQNTLRVQTGSGKITKPEIQPILRLDQSSKRERNSQQKRTCSRPNISTTPLSKRIARLRNVHNQSKDKLLLKKSYKQQQQYKIISSSGEDEIEFDRKNHQDYRVRNDHHHWNKNMNTNTEYECESSFITKSDVK